MREKSERCDGLVLVLAGLAGLLLALCLLLAARIYSPRARELMLQAGTVEEALPSFEVESLAGERLASRQLKGRKHLLFFGDPGCPSCRDFYPALRRVQKVMPVLFIGRGDRDGLRNMVEKEGFVFPVVFDSLLSLARSLEISSVPAALLVGPEGTVTHRASASGTASVLIEYAQRHAD